MKIKLVLFLFLGLCSSNILLGQDVDQLLYVAVKRGLELKSEPSLNSNSLQVLNLNDSLKVIEKLRLDTIDLRISNWIKCATRGNRVGYVFAGYLNQFPLPLDGYVSFREYIDKYVEVNFLELSTAKFVDDQPGDKYDKTILLSFGDNYVVKAVYEGEYGDVEYTFQRVNLFEIINLIQYAELGGEELEYSLLQEAFLKRQDLDLFLYTHAISDPPEETIVIEAIYPAGVRIRIFGGM